MVGTGGAALYNVKLNKATGTMQPLAYKTIAASSERYENKSLGVLKLGPVFGSVLVEISVGSRVTAN